MSQILPTLLVLLLTGLIGWGLLYLIGRLDKMGGEGHGVREKAPDTAPNGEQKQEPSRPGS